jgi:hypothetical protein
MSAADALKAAHAAGVELTIDGADLMLEAAVQPPQAVLDALSRYKFAILALLQSGQRGWTAESWRAYFERRIAESNGLSRAQAKTLAHKCSVAEWLNQHPAPSAPGRCAWCNRAESQGAVVLPFGTEPGTHTWLHAECWRCWYEVRQADAIAALGAMGIG